MNQLVRPSIQARHLVGRANDRRRASFAPVVIGFGIWAVGCALLQLGWIETLFLFAPLVVVPLGLGLRRYEAASPCLNWLRPVGAGLLFPSLALEQGPVAALLSVPWLVATVPTAVAAARNRVVGWRSLDSDFLFDLGCVFLTIGAAGLVVQRAGLQPMGLPHVINLLFAVHYHYAGFGLSTLAGALSASRRSPRLETLAGTASISAVLLLAIAIGLAEWLAPVAAVWMAATGGTIAIMQLRHAPGFGHPVRELLLVSGVAGVLAMPLGAAYGLRALEPFAWLTIPWMASLHGTVNSFGFVLAGLVGWSLVRREDQSRA